MKRLSKNKILSKLIILIIIMLILGILYIAILRNQDKTLIKTSLEVFFKSLKKPNYIKILTNSLSTNLMSIILIFILSLSIIGIPIIVLTLSYKSFVLGFTISSIIYYYKLKGILISLIYIIPLILNLFVILILSYYGISISKKLIKLFFYKKEIPIKKDIRKYCRLFILLLIFTLINCFIESYFIPFILSLLQI